MEQRLSFLTLGVSDLKRSRDFYVNVFGWKPEKDLDEDQVVFFRLNGFMLALFPRPDFAEDVGLTDDSQGLRTVALAHNVGSEAAVDLLFAELVERGARATRPPEKVYWGGYRGYLSDPDGYHWEIAYNPFLNPSGPAPIPG